MFVVLVRLSDCLCKCLLVTRSNCGPFFSPNLARRNFVYTSGVFAYYRISTILSSTAYTNGGAGGVGQGYNQSSTSGSAGGTNAGSGGSGAGIWLYWFYRREW